MQSTLEFSGALTAINQTRHETAEDLLSVRRMLSSHGFNLLQTADGNGLWTGSHTGWRGGCTLVLQTGAPSFFFGTVPPGQTGFALPLVSTEPGFFCGLPWPENQVGILGGGSRFGLRLPAGSRLRIVFSTTPRGARVWTQTPAFLNSDTQTLLQIENSLTGNSTPPPGVSLLETLSGPVVPHTRRARRDCERVGIALDMFLADLKKSLSPSVISVIQGVSLRTLENACMAIVGHGPTVLQRLVRLNAVRHLLEQGREKKVSRAADSVGLTHHGRFSAVYKDLFGESPSRTLPKQIPAPAER